MLVNAAEYAAAGATVHNNICGIAQTTFPKAAVYPYYIRERDPKDWAGALESEKDPHPESGRAMVSAVCISFVGLVDGGKHALQSLYSNVIFHFAIYKEYISGTDEASSANEFRDTCFALRFNLWKATDLGDKALVQGHEGLNLPGQADLIPMGNRQVHFMPGSMIVLMQPAQAKP